MSLRATIRGLTPPIILDLKHGGRRFSSWEAASKASIPYDNEALNTFKVARAAQRPVDGSILASSVLPLVAMTLKPDLAVNDFGGSTGDLGLDFLAAFPRATYTVVETPTMVALMKGRGPVRFETSLPAECDLFFSSGTLQYVERPMEVLASAFASARSAVVLTRNSFCDEDLFRVQRSKLFANGSGPIPQGYQDAIVSYPHRTINERAVQEVAKVKGFRCVSSVEEQSGVLPYRGKVYGRQLVFLRR
jgi:putative methyltransferase (TIGR04325 family)